MWAVILMMTGGLGACVSSDMGDLERQTNEILARPGGQIEPIPQMKPHERYLYQSSEAGHRDPFKPLFGRLVAEPKERTLTKEQQRYQDEIQTHTPEDLEGFELDSLRMVGTLEQGGVRWGLVKDREGMVRQVKVGNYMGRNYGKVMSITEENLEVREIVDDGQGGWQERQASLKLTQE
jgi:type IV pilus assembly protein PilP